MGTDALPSNKDLREGSREVVMSCKDKFTKGSHEENHGQPASCPSRLSPPDILGALRSDQRQHQPHDGSRDGCDEPSKPASGAGAGTPRPAPASFCPRPYEDTGHFLPFPSGIAARPGCPFLFRARKRPSRLQPFRSGRHPKRSCPAAGRRECPWSPAVDFFLPCSPSVLPRHRPAPGISTAVTAPTDP